MKNLETGRQLEEESKNTEELKEEELSEGKRAEKQKVKMITKCLFKGCTNEKVEEVEGDKDFVSHGFCCSEHAQKYQEVKRQEMQEWKKRKENGGKNPENNEN